MWARNNSGLLELTNIDPAGRWADGGEWLPVPESVVQYLTAEWRIEGGEFLPPSLDYLKAQVKATIAARRYAFETRGVDVNGVHYRTDRESCAALTGAYSSLTTGLLSSVSWKTGTGEWVELNAETVQPVARAVAEHVQLAFELEQAHGAVIDDMTTVAELVSYNTADGWSTAALAVPA